MRLVHFHLATVLLALCCNGINSFESIKTTSFVTLRSNIQRLSSLVEIPARSSTKQIGLDRKLRTFSSVFLYSNTVQNENDIRKEIKCFETVCEDPPIKRTEIIHLSPIKPSIRQINDIVKTVSHFLCGCFVALTLVYLPSTAYATTSSSNGGDSLNTAALESSLASKSSQLSSSSTNIPYWDAINSNSPTLIMDANEKLLDYGVGTINTMYYDNTGGARFNNADMFEKWRALRQYNKGTTTTTSVGGKTNLNPPLKILGDELPNNVFVNREGAVNGLKWLVSTLNDPYSKYLTREELREEFSSSGPQSDGFLGLGMIVESVPKPIKMSDTLTSKNPSTKSKYIKNSGNDQVWSPSLLFSTKPSYGMYGMNNEYNNNQIQKLILSSSSSSPHQSNKIITAARAENLPIVVAVKPNSPAERSGIVVGDRIAEIGSNKFMGFTQEEVSKILKTKYNAENYIGYPELTIAKPILRDVDYGSSYTMMNGNNVNNANNANNANTAILEQVPTGRIAGYRISRVKLPTSSLEPFRVYKPNANQQQQQQTSNINSNKSSPPFIAGGNSVCYYELLTPNDSIFNSISLSSLSTSESKYSLSNTADDYVGYIRLTRFSRSSTAGYLEAVKALEQGGATSYIIDLRNNYGGIIQEAMLTASTLLRDPSTVLCYTINSRGGFTPHDVEEYVVDTRYPGYLLSSEPTDVTLANVRKNNPNIFRDGEWLPPSQYASLHEQGVKRGSRPSTTTMVYRDANMEYSKALQKQKKVVLLINEGTASSAEVFASSLHDNGRTVALVGAKTYGKGLIQHTFPMPDGGGLRLTVAEYLTPALQHVTKVGGARYDPITGEMVGGGVFPDVQCETKGIPSNPGADLCVGIALDILAEAP